MHELTPHREGGKKKNVWNYFIVKKIRRWGEGG